MCGTTPIKGVQLACTGVCIDQISMSRKHNYQHQNACKHYPADGHGSVAAIHFIHPVLRLPAA